MFLFFLFFSTIYLVSLLVAQMSFVLNNTSSTRKSDFLLERLRACMLLDSMSRPQDRFPAQQEDRYWVQAERKDEPRKEGSEADLARLRPWFHWQCVVGRLFRPPMRAKRMPDIACAYPHHHTHTHAGPTRPRPG